MLIQKKNFTFATMFSSHLIIRICLWLTPLFQVYVASWCKCILCSLLSLVIQPFIKVCGGLHSCVTEYDYTIDKHNPFLLYYIIITPGPCVWMCALSSLYSDLLSRKGWGLHRPTHTQTPTNFYEWWYLWNFHL